MILRKLDRQDKREASKLLYELRIDFHRKKLLKNSPIRPFLEYNDTKKTMRRSLKELYDKNHVCFLAEEKGHVIGYISGQVINLPHKIFSKEGYIDDWYIREKYRGKGIGRKLYDKLLEEFKRKKCTHISIGSVYTDNKQVIEIYHHLGFLDFYLTLKKKINP